MSNAHRLATVTTTGARYLVKQIDFKTDTVYCWGEVTAATGAATTHGTGVKFALAAVKVAPVVKTPALARELFGQYLAGLRAAGHTLTVSGRKHTTVTIHPTAEQREEARKARAAFVADPENKMLLDVLATLASL